MIPLEKIAKIIKGKIVGDGTVMISGIKPLDTADNGDISFFVDNRYLPLLETTGASAIITASYTPAFKGPQVLLTNPGAGYARVAAFFAPKVSAFPGISQHAFIDESSSIGEGSSVYPMAYVGRNVVIGKDVILFSGVFVGDGVKIGDRTVIYPNVSILHDCSIGNDVIIHAGTVIGSDGFGYVRDGTDSIKIPQTGTVQIDDNVEIGANNCIDRATFEKTWIKRGVKTDNLVHIAHNVIIGEGSLIVAQAGISGSVTVGRETVIGGQVGIVDHVKIGDRVMIGSQSGVPKSIPDNQIRSGSPALPHRLFLRVSAAIPKLPRMIERLRQLENRVKELENNRKN